MPRTENSRTLFLFTATIYLILLLSAGPSCAVNSALDFTLTNLEGQKVTLSSYRGKVVVLNFWGTWCEPCKAEMPSLNKLYLEYRDKGLVVLAISIDQSEQKVKSFIS